MLAIAGLVADGRDRKHVGRRSCRVRESQEIQQVVSRRIEKARRLDTGAGGFLEKQFSLSGDSWAKQDCLWSQRHGDDFFAPRSARDEKVAKKTEYDEKEEGCYRRRKRQEKPEKLKISKLAKTGETELDDGLYGVQCAGTTPD